MQLERHEELLLLAHLTGRSRTEVLLTKLHELPDETRRAFFDACERRRKGEPLQYILGEWDFYGLTFKTDARALIPRAETELLVEKVLAFVDCLPRGLADDGTHAAVRILDVCTGTGCIAITLAKFLREKGVAVDVMAIDISADALSLARENALLHGVENCVGFVQGDLADSLNEGQFDVVISNPPYILASEMATLQTEVRDYEPHLALDGGADGMDLYRRLLPQAYRLLRAGGGLFLEIGPREVTDLTRAAGFENVQLWPDYAGLDRMITAIK